MNFSGISNKPIAAGQAVIVIDVQNCFLPEGSLATINSRNTATTENSTTEQKRAAADGLGMAIAEFVNKKNPQHLFVSKDWHPNNHISFASSTQNPGFKNLSFTKTWKVSESTNPTAYEGRTFPADGQPGYRFWGDPDARKGQLVWPDHCLQNSDDARVAPKFLETLDDNQVNKVVNIIKGDDPATDSYSVIASALGEFTPHVEGEPTQIFKNILEGAGLNTIYLTGIARNVCVYWSAMDILNYITVPLYINTNHATKIKVVFMYNLTRPVVSGTSDMGPAEIEVKVRDLLRKMLGNDSAYGALFEVRGDGRTYNAAGGRRNRRNRNRSTRRNRNGNRNKCSKCNSNHASNKCCGRNHRHTKKCRR